MALTKQEALLPWRAQRICRA